MRLLASVAFVALAVAVVRDIGLDVVCGQILQVALGVVAGVGGDDGLGRAVGRGGRDHREQQLLFAAGAVGLRVDDDLRLGIDCRDTGVALDHAFAGGHLGRFVIGAVGQAHAAF